MRDGTQNSNDAAGDSLDINSLENRKVFSFLLHCTEWLVAVLVDSGELD